jgi:DNA-binding PadR family transcriptional regulator
MTVRYALLALLSEGSKYGLQLRNEFEARAGEMLSMNVGRVFTTLQRLERDRLVESDDAGANVPRKRFQITPGGERELAGWLRTPLDLASSLHDELAKKILVALWVPGTDVHEVVQVHRRYLVERMQQWTRMKEDKTDDDLGLALAVDAKLVRLGSVVRWLDTADRRIGWAASEPLPGPPTLPGPRVRVGVAPGRTNHEEASRALADRIRISDADRERATARLRDHFAEGRLTREELDERVTAALNARTAGDLRRVLADLPEPAPVLQEAGTPPTTVGRRGSRMLPLAAVALLGVLLMLGGGWPYLFFLQIVVVFGLIVGAAAIIAVARSRRRRRY